jgi:hypothetical protein
MRRFIVKWNIFIKNTNYEKTDKIKFQFYKFSNDLNDKQPNQTKEWLKKKHLNTD